ncbi:MAG TPA: hypothetical protein VGC87_10030 [Pyrinomonadaceae bacterium]|jgi:hypothetical protein
MKKCPECKRTYPDDTLAFCLMDGAVLSAPYDPRETRPVNREPLPTLEISSPAAGTNETSPSLSSKRSGRRVLLLTLAVAVLLATGLVIGANWKAWFGGDHSQAKQSGLESGGGKATPQPTPSLAPSATPQSTPTPKPTPTPTPAKRLDVKGTWTGTFANRDAVLYLNSQEGDSFSGILKNSKGAIIAVSGQVNWETRRITMQEDRIVEQVKDGAPWVLGTNTGWISADGKRLNGSGKDPAGHSYTFTFTKN